MAHRYEMGQNYVAGDAQKGDALRGSTVQADARAAFSSGDVTAAGCRSLSRAWVSE